MTETKRLGRGLEALIGPVSREQAEASGALRELPLSSVKPNPYQPRTRIDQTELTDLAKSMEASGLLQPVIVRPRDGGFELIAGERRWRAAQQLGWPRIPAVVKEVDDRTLLTLALIENLQRDDLSPIDEAAGYRRLGEEFHLGHSEIAAAVGRDRSTVANLLRLLQLPPDVQVLVHEKQLSAGHARALLGLPDAGRQSALAAEAVEQGWSVREVEAAVAGKRAVHRPAKRPGGQPVVRPATADVKRVEDALRRRLGTDVRVTARRRGRGFVTISYYSNDDLSRLLELILGGPFEG
ncbi:MAG TPA: ParB/RepB/Spo0J family partition protein [Gemmatimonadales bacterium]|nr:ParB/RepB/Spo0J family partition protein [Gemmatimonadales bacterium]